MDGGVQTKFPKNGICMLFPESWGFGVPLHRGEYGNDVSRGYRWVSFVIFPPFSKRPIGANVKTLFWRWGFGKSVANIRTKNQHVFGRSDGIEKVRACLVDAVGYTSSSTFTELDRLEPSHTQRAFFLSSTALMV